MLSFRNNVIGSDPESIRQIASSTGFFDSSDVEDNVSLAKDLLRKGSSYTKQTHNFLFTEYKGQTVAYVCFGIMPDARKGTYEIHWLSTLNEFRGLGIGRKLLETLINSLKAQGAHKIYLKTDSKEQYRPTRNFYESCGFKIEAILKGYYDDFDDCCIYALQLDKDEFGLNPSDYVFAE